MAQSEHVGILLDTLPSSLADDILVYIFDLVFKPSETIDFDRKYQELQEGLESFASSTEQLEEWYDELGALRQVGISVYLAGYVVKCVLCRLEAAGHCFCRSSNRKRWSME